MVVLLDPRQSTLLLLGPFSTPYGEWGWWQVAGWPADPSSHPLQKGEWGEGVVAGAQMGKYI